MQRLVRLSEQILSQIFEEDSFPFLVCQYIYCSVNANPIMSNVTTLSYNMNYLSIYFAGSSDEVLERGLVYFVG